MKILSALQIRDWDVYTIENEPIASLDLMERAAGKCTEWITRKYSTKHTFKIFCGKGNNGGDGLAIARLLHESNYLSEVYILEFGAPGTPDFQTNLSRLHEIDLPVHFIQSPEFFPELSANDITIDALFGSGVNRPLTGLSEELVNYINQSEAKLISIDLPSGMRTDAATLPDPMVKANTTLTFQALKLCFLIPENEEYFGNVELLDIGLHTDFLNTISARHQLTDREMVKNIYRPRKKFSHKGTYGHSLIIAGEKGKMGAAVLCAKACLKSGAGLVTAMVPENEMRIIQTALPEAMAITQENIEKDDLSKYACIAVGPGLGTGDTAVNLLMIAMSQSQKPIVVDADGLNILAARQSLFDSLPKDSVLTPHPKEFERLFGKTNSHFERIELASKQAEERGVFIIVKGAYSLLACPDGELFFNSTGNPGMATGGSGDVLTGIICSLLAQGYSPKNASLFGLYLHGLSADIGIRYTSEEAFTASDIVKYLGKSYLSIRK